LYAIGSIILLAIVLILLLNVVLSALFGVYDKDDEDVDDENEQKK
jgi:hypothetical protein